MNVQSGDLAYIKGCSTKPMLNGLFVTVKEFVGNIHAGEHYVCRGVEFKSPQGAPIWVIESTGPIINGRNWATCSDACLRPIKGGEGQDITISWKRDFTKELENVK